jgi:glycosyltransferase involved in cell wall biosynthesis
VPERQGTIVNAPDQELVTSQRAVPVTGSGPGPAVIAGTDASAAAEGPTAIGLTVVVLAHNEERRLATCLRSARFAEQIVVVDSGSTDDTVAIARAHGADVASHPDWQGFGVQRSRSLAHCQGARYLLFLDADEVVPSALRREIEAIVASGEEAAWRLEWAQMAFGRTLTGFVNAPGMPRLIHAACLLGFSGPVHEHAHLRPGTPVHQLRAKLIHNSYDSVDTSLKKLRQYALLGAAKRAAQGQRGGVLRGLASALALFLQLYVLRRAFLHGGPGFLYCYVLAQECFFRYAALKYDRPWLTENVER